MIFFVAAAALGMGGLVAYIAYEKGRAALAWGLYGVVAAPIALPHILLARAHDDEEDVWAEIRHNIQTQTVNDPAAKMGRPAATPASFKRKFDPLEAQIREPVKPESLKADMFADKSKPPRPESARAEPSFGAAQPERRAAARDFSLDPSERIGAKHAPHTPQPNPDARMRAPLSVDPEASRTQSRSWAGPLFATASGLVAVGVLVLLLGPSLARYIPAGLPFSAAPEVKAIAPNAVTTPAPTGAGGSTAGTDPTRALQPSTRSAFDDKPVQSDPTEVGTARMAGPIPSAKSDAKGPAYTPSGAAESNLALATKGMKPVDVPDEPAKSDPPAQTKPTTAKPAAPAPKAASLAPVAPKPTPQREVKSEPKAPAKAEAKSPTSAPANTPAPNVQANLQAKAAAKPEADDFLSMVNKAIGTGNAPTAKSTAPASASAGETVEQVSESNDLVQSVQRKLRERGYDPGDIDGRTGPKTVQAIREFQQTVGLPADGLIDVTLMERLGVVGRRLQFPGR